MQCGGEVRDQVCERCHTETKPDVPSPVDATVACPRCDAPSSRAPLVHRTLGNAAVWMCAHCRGCFVHRSDWDTLVSAICEGESIERLRAMVPPPPGAGPTTQQLFQAVACPMCGAPTERVTFAARSHVVIDVCAAHGIWFDAAELVSVLNFLRTRTERGDVPEPPMDPSETERLIAWMNRITDTVLTREEEATLHPTPPMPRLP